MPPAIPVIAGLATAGAAAGGAVLSKKAASDREEKAAKRQEDIVRQERDAGDVRAAELQAKQQETARLLRERLGAVGQPTDLETQRQSRIGRLEPELERILQALTSGDRGSIASSDLGRSIEGRLRGDLDQPRTIPFEETFDPAFQLLQEQIAQQAARRGLTGSGLELESLGRAGIDLAIKKAQERQNNRLLNEQLRQQSVSNAISGNTALEGISQAGRTELASFLTSLQSQEQQRRATQQELGRQSAFGSAEIEQTGTLQGIGQQAQARQNTFDLESQVAASNRLALQDQLDARRREQEQVLGDLAKQGISAGAGALSAGLGAGTGVPGGSPIAQLQPTESPNLLAQLTGALQGGGQSSLPQLSSERSERRSRRSRSLL